MVPLNSRSLVNDGRKTTSGGHAARERLLRGSDELSAQLVFQTILDLQHCCLLEETSSSSLICLLTLLFLPEKATVQALKGRGVTRLIQRCMHTFTRIYSTEAPKKAVCSAHYSGRSAKRRKSLHRSAQGPVQIRFVDFDFDLTFA